MNRSNKYVADTFLSAAMLLSGTMQGQAQCMCSANPAPGVHLDDAAIAAMGTLVLIGNGDMPACFLQRHPSPSIYTACETWKDAQGAQTTMAVGLARARQRFWETYPNKPGAAKASQEFAEWLFLKDLNYVNAALRMTMDGRATDNRIDFVREVNAVSFVGYGGSPLIDGGIKEDAAYEFYDWAMDVRANLGHPASGNPAQNFAAGFSLGMMGASEQKAIEASRAKYRKYVEVRDWEEFDAARRSPVGFEGAQHYAELLYLRDGGLKPAEAKFEACSAARVLGQNVAVAAAQKIILAPKDSEGTLMKRAGLPREDQVNDLTPMPEGVIGVYKYKLVAYEKLMTLDDDRRYLLSLLADRNSDSRGAFVGPTKWCFADSMYGRYVAAFGSAAVLQAAHAVRVTPKRMKDGWVLDTTAIGSTRFEPYPAFQDVLTRSEPRGYVRAMLGFGQNLYTASEIDSAYQKLSAAHGENAVLDAARRMAAGRPNLTEKSDLQTLLGMLGEDVPASQPARPVSKVGPRGPDLAGLQLTYGSYQHNLPTIKARLDVTERTLRGRGRTLPPDVVAARDQIDPLMRAAGEAIQRGDVNQADQDLKSVQAAVRTIEVFMNNAF